MVQWYSCNTSLTRAYVSYIQTGSQADVPKQPEEPEPFHVTEVGEPMTSHPKPNIELQLQRPVESSTPTSVRRKKNPMKKFMQRFQNAFKPLTHHAGLMIHPKIGHAMLHGRKLDAKRKADKFVGMNVGQNRKKFRMSDDTGFEAEASTDSFIVTEKTDDVTDGNDKSVNDKSANVENTKSREGKMYDYDDYYEEVNSDDGLSVEDRLKKLFKKDLNEKLFQRK